MLRGLLVTSLLAFSFAGNALAADAQVAVFAGAVSGAPKRPSTM